MSGHSHFNSIGGNPVPQVMPPAVDEINLGGQQPQVRGVNPGAQDGPQAVQNDAREQGAEILKQLDVLLLRAASSVNKAVDADALKTTLAEVNLDKDSRRAVVAAIDKASKAFAKINNFSGLQLAKAIKEADGVSDWNLGNSAGKAVKKAIDAQSELADYLREIVNQIPRGKVSSALQEAALQCDRRTCEIQTLICDFDRRARTLEVFKPEFKARLLTKLNKLLPEQALEMHGNRTAIAAMRAHVEPVARRLAALTGSPGAFVPEAELAKIGGEIGTMSSALKTIAESGAVGGIAVDSSLVGAVRGVLDQVQAGFPDVRKRATDAAMQTFIGKVFLPPQPKVVSVQFLPLLKAIVPELAKAVDRRHRLYKKALECLELPTKENFDELKRLGGKLAELDLKRLKRDVNVLLKYCCGVIGKLDQEDVESKIEDDVEENLNAADRARCNNELIAKFAQSLLKSYDAFVDKNIDDGDEILRAFESSHGLPSQVAHFEKMVKRANEMTDDKFVTNGTVYAVFEGKLRCTTLVESRIHGLEDEDVDPALDDLNEDSSKELGHGGMNTVFEVTYKDGSKYVFKPEIAARLSAGDFNMSKGLADFQTIAQINMATQKTADALGLGDVMAKTTVGSHKGDFGLFMEKVPGGGTCKFRDNPDSDRFGPNTLGPKAVRELPDEVYVNVVGDMMRKANRLEWFDLIVGQGDRHGNNIMIAVGNDKSVVVKGIDNDVGFPAYRTGVRTFKLDKAATERFKKAIDTGASALYKGSPEAIAKLKAALEGHKGVTTDENGLITVNTAEADSPLIDFALRTAMSIRTTALPDCIDEDLYNHLMDLEQGEKRDKYIADLKLRLSDDSVAAAVMRLDEAIAIAKRLHAEDKVVKTEMWYDKNAQRQIAGKLPPDVQKGEYPRIPKLSPDDPDFDPESEKLIAKFADTMRNGYFRRDLMRAVAKPGWFEE